MKMISFCNKKGGVGKTTLCKNVAYKLSLDGAKVLLIDLDPQATLSVQFSNKNIDNKKTFINFVPALKMVKINQIIQLTKYKNIDIILGSEELNRMNEIIKSIFKENEYYMVSEMIYTKNKNVFNSYDYVLIDYPPTINDFAINWLIMSDLILIPINDGIGSYKGILDLENTLTFICKKEKRGIPTLKIIFNNVKDDENTNLILKLISDKKLNSKLLETFIQHSKSYVKSENELNIIWTNQHYWRQKQAYEELIKEIK
ncbi:ParA family protein [Spiroplasma phoeniceum]|nr:ParA family protein [Spiroplasma phoeniceum]